MADRRAPEIRISVVITTKSPLYLRKSMRLEKFLNSFPVNVKPKVAHNNRGRWMQARMRVSLLSFAGRRFI